jgi:diguanylate cyclase (GGDEF)-like protein
VKNGLNKKSGKKQSKPKSNFPILVVEDNSITRKLLEKTLAEAGYEVVSTTNGRKALEKIHEKFFPIVITDYIMPEMDGLQLCRAIRKKKTRGYVFIVLLTAMDSKKDIIAGLEAGADDYLIKPINQAELVARLNSGNRVLELEKTLKKANEKIKRLSITDPLTGCLNRSYMMKSLNKEIKRAIRYNHPLSLIFCDIDHFKKVNDTHGHQVGDRVLREFSSCLLKMIRADIDWIIRYGGEEFLIVLPETTPGDAYLLAENIRISIAQRKLKIKKKVIHLTASFGVMGFDMCSMNQNISIDSMIKLADNNLYISKKQGRNRVTVSY